MISKRILLDKPFDMESLKKEKIIELYNPCSPDLESTYHALGDKDKTSLVKRKTQYTKDYVIVSMESEKDDILGTNLYITSSVISKAVPSLCKTIYIDSKMILFVYPNDRIVEKTIEELERVCLFIIGFFKSRESSDLWVDMLKTYVQSNIRFSESKNDTIVPEGEKYLYINNDTLFCNPDEFDDNK